MTWIDKFGVGFSIATLCMSVVPLWSMHKYTPRQHVEFRHRLMLKIHHWCYELFTPKTVKMLRKLEK